MRVLVDALIFQKNPYGGISRVFSEILPRMCDIEPELEILLFCDGPLFGDYPRHPQIKLRRSLPVRLTLRPRGFWRKILFPFRRMASHTWNHLRNLWIPKDKNIIWHSTFFTLPIAWKGPQVVSIHDMIPEIFPEIFNDPLDNLARKQKKRCVDLADAIICVSAATHNDITNYYGPLTVNPFIIHNAFSQIFQKLESSKIQSLNIQKPFILYVGSRAQYKNFTGLLDLYHGWKDRFQTKLLVVGSPWNSKEIKLMEDLNIKEQVSLFENIDDSLLCQLYNQAQAFIFPSLYEGFGIPILESLACGCPVVASRIPSSLEIGKDSLFYFDLDKPKTFYPALERAIAEGRTPKYIKLGLEVTSQFSWEITARKTLNVYREVLSRDKK